MSTNAIKPLAKKTNLQYNQPGQLNQLQVAPGQLSPALQTQSNQVLQQAGTQALQQAPTQTQQLTQQRTQELLQTPFNEQTARLQQQQQREQFDIQSAQQQEALRRSLAPISTQGAGVEPLIQYGLQTQQQRSELQRQQAIDIENQRQQALMAAIEAGRAQSGLESDLTTRGIQNLLAVRGAAEPALQREYGTSERLGAQEFQTSERLGGQEFQTSERIGGQEFTATEASLNRLQQLTMQSNDIAGQQAIATLQGKIQQGLLLTEQDFQGVQAALDREQQLALQNNDIEAAQNIELLRGQIAAQAQQAQFEFARQERQATQSWQSSERMSQNDFVANQQFLQNMENRFLQEDDQASAREMAELQYKNQLKMLTQTQDFETSQMILEDQLLNARANNDVERQKSIIEFQTQQDINQMREQFSNDQIMEKMRFDLQDALKQGDYIRANALQESSFKFQASEAIKDRQLEQLRIQLAERGIDFDQTLALVDQGIIEPDAAVQLIQSQVPDIQFTPFDAQAAMEAAIKSDFAAQQNQFLMTHPEYRHVDGGLTVEGQAAFNDFFNESVYGERAMGIAEIVSEVGDLVGADSPSHPRHNDYITLKNSAQEWVPESYPDSKGLDAIRFGNPPAAGTVISYNGNLYTVLSAPAENKQKGTNNESIQLMNIATGQTMKVDSTSTEASAEQEKELSAKRQEVGSAITSAIASGGLSLLGNIFK